MTRPAAEALSGLTVLAFESRRAMEIAALIRHHGGTPISAPALREVPLALSDEARQFLAGLQARTVDIVVLLTGVGTRALVAALEPLCPRPQLVAMLAATRLIARGPKPVAALRDLGLRPDLSVPEPHTWRELLHALDTHLPVGGHRVAVQEYGRPNPELITGLRERGAEILSVPVYRWDYPHDSEPLRQAVVQLANGDVDIALFTSARQVDHVVETAAQRGYGAALLAASRRVVLASIGPVCSEALEAHGLSVDLEPEHPKMGQLVGVVAQRGRAVLEAKRAAASS